jgi:hypothetical protein
MLMAVDNPSALRLLRIYGINAPATDERFETDHTFNAGIAVTIDGIADARFGPSIRLKIAKQRGSRMCPVAERDAENLVREFHHPDALPPDEKRDRTLVTLIVKCSQLFLASGVGEFHLLLYLTPQGYRTHAVYMMRARRTPAKTSRGTA